MDDFGLINYLEDEPVEEDTTVGVKENLYHNHQPLM